MEKGGVIESGRGEAAGDEPVTDPLVQDLNEEAPQEEPIGDPGVQTFSLNTTLDQRQEVKLQRGYSEVDQTTGAFTYRYDINLTPGRNGLTPELYLSYNSLNKNEWTNMGHGWDISIPYIKRLNKTGNK